MTKAARNILGSNGTEEDRRAGPSNTTRSVASRISDWTTGTATSHDENSPPRALARARRFPSGPAPSTTVMITAPAKRRPGDIHRSAEQDALQAMQAAKMTTR